MSEKSEDADEEFVEELGLTIHPIRSVVSPSNPQLCICNSCSTWSETTWSLSYFVVHGLDIQWTNSLSRRCIFISADLCAQVFRIMARRYAAMQRCFTLREWSAYKIYSLLPTASLMDELKLPKKVIVEMQVMIPLLNDIIDYHLSREGVYTIFCPLRFARYLLRHLGMHMKVDSWHYERRPCQVNWMKPPKALKDIYSE